MNDGYGRKINYLRLSVTDLCNLRCRYCMPSSGICKSNHAEILTFEEMVGIVKEMARMGIDKVRLTGGEPLVRKGIIQLIEMIKSIDGIKELSLTTNGILLESYAKDLKAAGLDRVNVSLDTLNDEKFRRMTRGGDLSKVLRGIDAARRVGLDPIKLNVVLIGGFNDDEIGSFVRMSKKESMDVRFIELMPIGLVAKWNHNRFISTDKVLREFPVLNQIEATDSTSPAVYYQLPGAKGRIGLIRPITCKFCQLCNRVRMTADGKLKYCLHSDHELDIRAVYRAGGDLKESIEDYINQKPFEHSLEDGSYIKKGMMQIGG